ncbi:hypothetical protein BDP27DRAFT_536209 [Rhodocollybia butyracea]|uniref:Uncharacterized protein n=1 Tax=Rhodocollybia butyracea TaxID=206335 RepID=A0A9P5Q065_9AGAR|nr:hypothetical protein BDP27DRAFT_536209 [Rhodocollybia butyracea]
MSKTSESIWCTARGNVKDLPPCPKDLNEPQYALLLFEAYCHLCNRRCDNVFWNFRTRSCKKLFKFRFIPVAASLSMTTPLSKNSPANIAIAKFSQQNIMNPLVIGKLQLAIRKSFMHLTTENVMHGLIEKKKSTRICRCIVLNVKYGSMPNWPNALIN